MGKRVDLIASFLFYGIGLFSILIADIYVSENFNDIDLSDWAFYKSTLFLVGSICMMGYEQVFVRDITLIKRVFNRFLIQSLLIILIVCLVIYLTKINDLYTIVYLFLCIFSFAILNYYSAGSRANFNLWKAQFSLNSWKVLLLISLILFSFDQILFYFLISLFIISLISIYLKGILPKKNENIKIILKDKEAKKIAFAFLLSNLTLIITVHGEQFLINLFGNSETSVHLFRYFAIFTPIALSLNGFLGFYFGPKVRKENNMNIKRYVKFTFNIIIYTLIFSLLSLGFGYYYMQYLSDLNFINFDWLLIVTLILMCMIRGIYISTSVCLGVFGSSIVLKKLALQFWLITLFYLITIFFILYFSEGVLAAQQIAIATLINWFLRLVISNFHTVSTLKKIENV